MNTSLHRRQLLKMVGLGSAATIFGNLTATAASRHAKTDDDPAHTAGELPAATTGKPPLAASTTGTPNRTGLPPVTIRSVKAIGTAPQGANLVVVKVETSEPGLYGLGCATFTQRAEVVVTAINNYMPDFCVGKNVDDIEDLWQSFFVSSYWRNGPVLNNALSGLNQALWDIKGKRAGMPVYQLLGGKSRFAVDCYTHASGRDLAQLEESVKANLERGFRHIRIQIGGYGSPHLSTNADFEEQSFGLPVESHMDARPYLNAVPKMFEHIRGKFGDELE